MRVFTVKGEVRRQDAKQRNDQIRKAWQAKKKAERQRLKGLGLSKQEIRQQIRKLVQPEYERPHRSHVSQYQAYLQSDQWRVFRLSVIAKRGPYCEQCRSTQNVQLHHTTYERIFHERYEDVKLLCRSCHESEHGIYPVTILRPALEKAKTGSRTQAIAGEYPAANGKRATK